MAQRRQRIGLDLLNGMDMAGLDHSDGGPITEAMLEQRLEKLNSIALKGSAPAWRLTSRGKASLIALGGSVVLVLALSFIHARSKQSRTPEPPAPGRKQGKNIPLPTAPNPGAISPAVGKSRPAGQTPEPAQSGRSPVAPGGPTGGGSKGAGTKRPSTSRSASAPARRGQRKIARRSIPGTTLPTLPEWKAVNEVGMEFALIPAGGFRMGADPNDPRGIGDQDNERPQHPVRISHDFYLGIFEVTQQEYELVTKKKVGGFKGSPRLPVESVSWFDAVEFCNAMSDLEGLPRFYRVEGGGNALRVVADDPDSIGYRLPTEAEWEYACRAPVPGAGTQAPYSFGSNEIDLLTNAWFLENSGGRTHEVGRWQPNAFHLYDMHGNVWEWCWDWHQVDYYIRSPDADPTGPISGLQRIRRGGSYEREAVYARSAYRAWAAPTTRYPDIGFRVARSY